MSEIYPFLKIAWRSEKIRREWEPIRNRIYNANAFTEYESVKRGLRSCDVYQLDPDRFDEQIKKATLDRLHFLPILRSRRYTGFGHVHYEKDTIDGDTFIYGVVSNTLEGAIEFHDAGVTNIAKRIKKWTPEEMNPNGIDHDVTGRLLGYNKKSRDLFNDVWLTDGCVDPEYEIALNTDGVEVENGVATVYGHPALNRMIRYWGFQLIPYFPHSFTCKESIKFADWWFDLMVEYDEEAAKKCHDVLNMPMTWSVWNGIIYVEHPLFVGAANGYYPAKKKTVVWAPA